MLHYKRAKVQHHLANNGPYSQSYDFSSNHVWIWELDHEEGWALKYWCFWAVVLENTWESLGLQGEQTSYSCRKLVLNIHWEDWCWSWSSNTWPTWCEELTHWKRPDAGKDWGREENQVTEDQMVVWHHLLNGHKLEPTLGNSEGQGSLACCSSWGHKGLAWFSNWTTNVNFLFSSVQYSKMFPLSNMEYANMEQFSYSMSQICKLQLKRRVSFMIGWNKI